MRTPYKYMLKYRRASVRNGCLYIPLANFVQKFRLPSGSEHVGHFVHLSAPLLVQKCDFWSTLNAIK